MKKIIAFGCDHAGLPLKETLKNFALEQGYDVLDVGTQTLESCDYPTFANKLCDAILNKEADLGVLVCGTGIGMCIAANRHKGIQAALCHTEYEAKMARCHNHGNVICFGSRVIGDELAISCLEAFLTQEPSNDGRHQRRVQLMNV